MLRNTETSYGCVSIVLHWLMAVAIFGMFGLGLWMTELNYYDKWYHDAPEIHKSIGMLLLFALLFRLAWRLTNPHPKIVGGHWERLAALAVHRSHYVLMFIVLVAGYLIPTAEGVGIDLFGWFKGKLTLHGVTKAIAIQVKQIGTGADPWGGYRRGFEGHTTLHLSNYRMKKSGMLGAVSENVELFLSIEGLRTKLF